MVGYSPVSTMAGLMVITSQTSSFLAWTVQSGFAGSMPQVLCMRVFIESGGKVVVDWAFRLANEFIIKSGQNVPLGKPQLILRA